MKFVVPENIGNELRVLPPDTYETEIKDVILGESASKNPKLTILHTVLSEYSGKKDADFQSCIGETILDTVSLQPQAMWRVNDYYKAATGERIPAQEYEPDEFVEMIKSALIGARFSVLVDTDSSQGDERTKVSKFTALKSGKPGGKKVRR